MQEIEKKRPGRPKKKGVCTLVEVHGIVNEPANNADLVELVYDNPILFKRILHLYAQYRVSEVELEFALNGLTIYGVDHLGKSMISSAIDGECMNMYHCREPIRVCVKQAHLYKVLGSLDKSNYKITLVLRENFRSAMYVTVKDLDFNNDNEYIIDVIYKPEQTVQPNDDSNYPLKFRFPAKHFKTLVGKAKKMGMILVIQKIGTSPLQLTLGGNCVISWAAVYNDPSKIHLDCVLGPDDSLVLSVGIDYIKPFSNSGLTEDIVIAVGNAQRLSMSTTIDSKGNRPVCAIKVFTEVIESHH